jgi:peptide/nickel transport system permease protein
MAAKPSTITNQSVQSPAARARQRFWRNYASWVGMGLVMVFLLVAAGADFLSPYSLGHSARNDDPAKGQVGLRLNEPASGEHWLGTDANAKDLLTRVMHGARLSLLAGVVSILLAVAVGVPVGAAAGYFGGWVDALLMRTVDVALAFPSVLIALLVAAAFHPGWGTVIIAVGLINVPIFARQVRATVMSVVHQEYVLASKALGAGTWHILMHAIGPALLSPVAVLASLSVGTAILEVAGLAFLGLVGDSTVPEWGCILGEARQYWRQNICYAFGPGSAISLAVLGFNLLGDGLRDAFEPRQA